MHGALLAALAAGARGAPAVMHARSLNPYVAAAVADWRRTHGLTVVVPRVPAALAACKLLVCCRQQCGTALRCPFTEDHAVL